MQISENLLRVIFMLSTIVVVTDCCSSRLLLLKEHTLQIVQQHRLRHSQNDDYDYEHEDYEQLQRQQQQQLQQKIPQYVDIAKSDIDFIKNYAEEHKRSRDKDEHEENTTETEILGAAMQLGNFGSDSYESLLGIFDAAAFDTTTTTTTTTTTRMSTTSMSSTVRHSTTPRATAATTNAQQSTRAESEISTTQRARTSTVVVEPESMESSSTTMTIPISSTIASSAGAGGGSSVENVMNVRDLLSLPCSGQFNTEFCLNRGRCFRYPIGNDTIHSCICADGYIGERCESKSMNGSFIPSIKKQKILMARIVFSFPMLVALSVIYIMVGAAIVFKRPVPPTHSIKERMELLPDDDAGELILLNSYPMVDQTVTYSTYAD
uniref:Protein gurken n=1 Tax=Zeugodacus cucurbitae TaxID=28588 RepID=A0A0A1WTG3_ZEUCU